jgi:hypothetical protein
MDINFNSTPSIATLRKHIRDADSKSVTRVTFTYGEQSSEFEKVNGRWHHNGNGCMKAAYKLSNELDAAAQKSRGSGAISF